jgi:hypothetical protein
MGAEAGRLVRDKTRAWEKGGAQQKSKKRYYNRDKMSVKID